MLNRLKDIILNSDNIVFFGGAGTSTESNIPDFRSAEGIFRTEAGTGYRPEEILSYSFFSLNPEEFYKFYKNKMIYREAKPNKAHYALAYLEKASKVKAVITQNIDGLHQLAGSQNVLELHGSVHRNYCMNCYNSYDLDFVADSKGIIPKCVSCGGIVRPDVVLYEEGLDMDLINRTIRFISNAEVLIIGGTSLTVYPAAGLINYYRGNNLVLINKTATPRDNEADMIINESIGKALGYAADIL